MLLPADALAFVPSIAFKESSQLDLLSDDGIALMPSTPSPPPPSKHAPSLNNIIIDVSAMEERRVRRRISNRESARRSRVRKQQHLEGLKIQATQLKLRNQEVASRLKVILQHCNLFHQDNTRLRLEYAALKHRLVDAQGSLMLRQLQRLASNSQLQLQLQLPVAANIEPNNNLPQAAICGQHLASTVPTGLMMEI